MMGRMRSIVVTLLLLVSQPTTSFAKNELFGNPNLPNDGPISNNKQDDESSSMSMSMSMPDTVPVPQVVPNPNDTNDVPNPNLPTGDDDTTSTTTSSGGEFANPNLMTKRPTRKSTSKPTPSPTIESTNAPVTDEPTDAPVTSAPTPCGSRLFYIITIDGVTKCSNGYDSEVDSELFFETSADCCAELTMENLLDAADDDYCKVIDVCNPTDVPTESPTDEPTPSPTPDPTTMRPTSKPSPTPEPTLEPTNAPVTKAPITTYPSPNEDAEVVSTTTTSPSENEMGGSNASSPTDNDPDDEKGDEGGVVPVASPNDNDEPTLSPAPESTRAPVTAEEAATIEAACDALVNGTSPSTNVSSSLNYTYEVTVNSTDSDEVEAVIDKIEKNLKLYVGAQLFGCDEPARRRRRMKSDVTAVGIHGYPSERVLDGETCEIPSDDCFVASGGMTLIMNDETSMEDAEASTLDALKIIHEAMNVQNPSPFVAGEKYGVANVKGVGFLEGTTADGSTIDKEGEVTTDRGTTIDEIKSESTTAQSNSRLSTGGIVALSLCLLALVLALVLLLTLRKRSTFKELQNEQEASDSDSDVFDDVSMDDDTMSLQSPRKKQAYIVGEEESVYTRDTKVCTPEGWPSDEEGVEITNDNIDRIYPLRMGRQTKFISAFDDGREVSVLPFENPGAIRRRSLIEDTVDL